VQAGLAAADTLGGCEVWVAQGVYTPTSGTDQTISFQLVSGVDVYGGFAGGEVVRNLRDWENNETVLSGNIGDTSTYGDNSHHVVEGADDATLDGFVIEWAYSCSGEWLDERGGGLRNDGVSPTIVNCVFRDNRACNSGGGMFNLNASPTVDNCEFRRNVAHYDGGAIRNYTSSIIVTDTLFHSNISRDDGGAISNWQSSTTFEGCMFFQNGNDETTIGGNGGAIYDSEGSLTVDDCLFFSNLVLQDGGAVHAVGDISISNSTFFDNRCDSDSNHYQEGGAVRIATDTGGITDSLFQFNQCDYGGGVSASGTVNISQNDFIGNTAPYGGAVYLPYGTPTVADCGLYSNYAQWRGGGIYVESAYSLDTTAPLITSCVFEGNSTDNGGSGVYSEDADTVVSNSVFRDNWTESDGGAVYCFEGSALFESCVFGGNQALENGGVAFATGAVTVTTFVNCDVVGNSALSGGGFYLEQGTLSVDNSIVRGNFPEGFANDGGSVTTSYSNIEGGEFPGIGNNDSDPLFENAPIETTFTTAMGATNSVVVANLVGTIAVDSVIEIEDDGVARIVTVVAGDYVSFTPQLGSSSIAGMRVDHWGPGVTDMALDLHLEAGSLCIDAADGLAASGFDMDGNPRVDDPGTANTGVGPPWADMGAYEYQP
jgi:predicted outer membrane repeat protein